jgi:hypothetical protein
MEEQREGLVTIMSEKKAQFPLDDKVMVQEGDGIYRECIAIPDYNRRYYISKTGNVVSFKRGRMTILKPVLTGSAGYLAVNLYDQQGKMRMVRVHVLMLLTFVGPRPEGQIIRHLDGDRNNNCLYNLTYGTYAENEADKQRHGTWGKNGRGLPICNNESLVRKIRNDYLNRKALCATVRSIAAKYGIAHSTVCKIGKKQQWAWVS